ncbi:MAG: tyrosine-type recombinase/integrase [Legionellaceae bacterium]|nr:tyrosine-type recombinase/integrase [Legionellaceae bacterium]
MLNFTETYIKRLQAQDKRLEKFEGGGFGIFIYPAGTKSWIYRYKINHKKDYIILGHYPEISLVEARNRFHKLRAIRRTGINPKLSNPPELNHKQNTVKKFILSWYTNYIEKNRKKPLQIKQQIDADIIPLLGNMDLDKLQPIDITQAMDSIVKRGAPIHANRVLATLKQAFNYAVSHGNITQNPASTIRSRDIGGLEKPRERFLTLEEIKRIWQFLDTDQSNMSLQTKSAIKIIILTGVRTAEIRLAKWNEFNFKNSLWTIPPENTKGTISVKIHLSKPTKLILEKLKSISDSPFVLPSFVLHQPLDENALPRAIRRIQARVGIPEWTARDLRRTFATQLGESLNIDPVVIQKCLGHKMPGIMATYNKNEMLPQRKDALERWAECIQNFIGEDTFPTRYLLK